MLDHVGRFETINKLVDEHLVWELDFGIVSNTLQMVLFLVENFDKFVTFIALLGRLVVLTLLLLNVAALDRLRV